MPFRIFHSSLSRVFLMTAFGIGLSWLATSQAHAFNPERYQQWLAKTRAEAIAAGISPAIVNTNLKNPKFIPRIIELDRKQPEKTRSFNAYKKDILSPERIAEGRRLYQTHRQLLKEIEQEYGVPAPVIVALWGIETHYGKLTGGYHVVDALSTLAYEGRRHDFFKKELFAALKILEEKHITSAAMKGSWAGAMGQSQFMPTSFLRFAQDHNNDGRRDIWGTLPDVFASAANYLNQSGWEEGQGWGQPVKLSPNFDETQIGLDITHPIRVWAAKGVMQTNGRGLTLSDAPASLIRPQDSGDQAYLVTPNYRAIMAWNKSTYFATTVGLLADRIAAPGPGH